MLNNINNKPIKIYWSPYYQQPEIQEWSLLFKKPSTLYSNLLKEKIKKPTPGSVFSCPAFLEKTKKTLVFENTLSSSYQYNEHQIKNISESFLAANKVRDSIFNFGPSFQFSLSTCFFSEEPLVLSFTSPYFHKSKHLNYGSIIPGEFDIGQWFRSFNPEFQMWNNEGEFHLEENEPIYYAEFKTKRPIILYRFELTEKLERYGASLVSSTDLFGKGQSLLDRYNRFKQVGFREKILTEINKNLIDEEPYQF